MKIPGLVFIILILSIAFKYTKVFDVDRIVIIGISVFWFICLYISIHLKNKDRNTPKPVYLTQ